MKVIPVTLYSKEECCLCQDAKHVLEEISLIYPIQVKEVNIYQNEELIELFGISIPVVYINEKEVASGIIHKDVIIKYIKSAFIS